MSLLCSGFSIENLSSSTELLMPTLSDAGISSGSAALLFSSCFVALLSSSLEAGLSLLMVMPVSAGCMTGCPLQTFFKMFSSVPIEIFPSLSLTAC